ncbi:hypothetical protein QFW96_17570 [Saccharopolyspora sp. TS4A08]|uniref:Uncharacterized protein n=1 Tax=Saccharopolyspora ipomoeae TaxID=3042027 RepID=A0ABT6PR12_9PSEU|nr:hypothetical protein [Saccharopolyspora sp. TS4A08]MDI2030445.1 hypothetical protein [Saccharopolyspora sp. TS4A08]
MGSNCQVGLSDVQRTLLRQAAAIVRRRYDGGFDGDTSVSVADAERLATIFEGISRDEPDFDALDRNEAIALAHRLVDDDHPEHSRMWPA